MGIQSFDMTTPLDGNTRQADDVLAIHRLWRQIGDDNTSHLAEDPGLLQTLMIGPDYYVARPAGMDRVIGAVSIISCRANLAKIDSLAVLPEYGRRGWGYRLAERALQHCIEYEDVETIMVTAMPTSQKIFRKLNFEVGEVHETGNMTMFLDL